MNSGDGIDKNRRMDTRGYGMKGASASRTGPSTSATQAAAPPFAARTISPSVKWANSKRSPHVSTEC